MNQGKPETEFYKIPEEIKDFAQRSVLQADKAFGGFLDAAEQTVDMMQGSSHNAQTQAFDTAKMAMLFTQQNMAAAFDLAKRMLEATDVSDLMGIQAEYLKEQGATLQNQAKTLTQNLQKTSKI